MLRTKINLILIVFCFVVSMSYPACGQGLPGVVLAKQNAVLTPGVTQNIVEICVEDGEWVKQGQLLATLDNRMAQAEYEAAKAVAASGANVTIAQIALAESQQKLARMRRALAEGASTELEVENAKNDVRKSEGQLQLQKERWQQAQQMAETAKQRLELYSIRAPFAGQITKVHIREGNRVDPSTAVFSIVSADELCVELHLPIAHYGKLQVGDTYPLSAGQPVSRKIKAKITHVSNVVDTATQTFRVTCSINNLNRKLPVGFPVTLSDEDLANTWKIVSLQSK